MPNHRAVVVIGAGISGLVCAFRLKMLGIDALLIEQSDRVGGVIQSERVSDFLIERGPNSSQGTEELMSLVQELGITSELVEGDPKAPAYVYFKGRLHAVPSGPWAFIKSTLLSLGGKLRIFKEPFLPVRREAREESVAAFARRRIGSEAAERLVAPFVSGIYAGDANRLSVQAAFPKLANLETGYGGLVRGMLAKAGEARAARKSAAGAIDKSAPTRKRMISFREGMGFLPKTLAQRLGEDLMVGCSDIRLRVADRNPSNQDAAGSEMVGGPPSVTFEVEFERASGRDRLSCDRIIIATPARAAGALVAPLSDDLRRLLDEIEYPPLAIVSLAYKTSSISARLKGFGFLAAPSEGLNILGCVWNSSLFAERAPADTALLTVFIGGARKPEAARQVDAELVSTAHSEL
ncbi:MAG TPA: protoporphyrinogen oxidase, partial [Blastocatellia bacterium]|nr:protoporphyrinogen oxidase [Blastocatellia bacterium]